MAMKKVEKELFGVLEKIELETEAKTLVTRGKAIWALVLHI